MSIVRVSVAVCALSLSACASSAPAPAPTPAKPAQVPSGLLEKVCKAKDVDRTSFVYVALDAHGNPRRIEVTPRSSIADMGNLVFDLDGNYLGVTTGAMFHWDDSSAMSKEKARINALMADSKIPDGQKPVPCP